MHSTACGVGASTSNSSTPSMQQADGLKMGLSNNDDAMNKIPLKSVTDDEEKNGGEFIHDTATAEEARREQRRVKLLNLMKKLTIGIICFIGIALISYVIISLCFSEWPKSGIMPTATTVTKTTTTTTTTETPSTNSTSLSNSNSPNQTMPLNLSSIVQIPNSTTNNDKNNPTSSTTTMPPHTHPSTPSSHNHAKNSTHTTDIPLIPPSASPLLSLPTTSNSSLLSDDKASDNGHATATSTSPLDSSSNQTLPASIGGMEGGGTTTAKATETMATPAPTQQLTTTGATTAAALSSGNATSAPPASAIEVDNDDDDDDEDAENAEDVAVVPDKSLLKDAPILEKNFTSKLGVYEKAAVCSDKPVCSQIGSNILQDGGSAVDSAIATCLCNGIATMHSMGIGGGMLMNVYIKEDKQAYSVDAREVAPYAATDDRYTSADSHQLLHGPLSIAVPGELMGYHRAHEKFGKLPWKKLVEPSLQICKDGFYVTKHQYNALAYKDKHMRNNTILRKMFYNETTNTLHPVGTLIQPAEELCKTYELLADNGPYDFYNGTLAKLVAEDLRELGSMVDYGDLETYRADLVSSVTMQLGDDILYAVPPISSGTIVSNILSILEGYNFTSMDVKDNKHEALTIHRIVEAMKFGFAKRWELGDARFNDVRELVSRLTNPETGIELRNKINDSSILASVSEYGAQYTGEDDVGTSALVVMAPNGDAVSVTSSVNDYFGSGLAGKRTGIIFNSAMNDFSLPGKTNAFALLPSPTNFIDAQKRPMSSMSPMILADREGNVKMAVSAAGGSKIISALVEVMAGVLWMNQDIKEAIDEPRYHHQLSPNVLEYEKNEHFTEELLKLLSEKGHVVKSYNYTGSVVCGIVKNDTAIYANADYRKQGGIDGF
ncbi:glutathione hydrolase 1 proenzyme isoform X1 [Stomoxys calcitrans]|uniref:glutathione hydrolase 1 proenzyme isoform X1 n=2 Tax=Stomoxys calcitrans TaxID=35570 RepID=UPI0027E25E30|nr:glutathione hydrolase 1 proenzyme isoform X1 [Stomoxys calcitrans]XP_013106048.2 glutathione hydrolase 1 proenzyme isoform X1 [Stomoxys calcitrans]